MNNALKLAREYGVVVSFSDLGDWGIDELRSEYDPRVPEIRINSRVAEQMNAYELGEFVTFAVGHELYHHREHIEEIPRLGERKEREIAADDFARMLAGR